MNDSLLLSLSLIFALIFDNAARIWPFTMPATHNPEEKSALVLAIKSASFWLRLVRRMLGQKNPALRPTLSVTRSPLLAR
ncbi:MAG: hypothetical protein ONB44_11580 [candidate division KSB1 bacterium]|nr:hypothetical protein [candidate division KSB1 bacterium]MDZ7302765.1 hypothetical protein [candidate division KSB1 bacterium]